MGEQRALRAVRLAEGFQASLANRLGEPIDHVLQHLVVAGPVDRVMKRRITVHPKPGGRDLVLHRNQRAPHRHDVLIAAPDGRELGKAHLEEFASLEHLGKPAPPFHKLVEHATEPAAATEENATAVAHLDESLRFQHCQRLTQRGPADLEARGQFALRREPLPNAEVGADDEFPETLDQILVQARAPERPERRGVEAHAGNYARKNWTSH